MSATPVTLIAAQDAPAVLTTLYTSPAAANGGKGTWIDKFTLLNHSAATAAISIYIVPSGSAAANSNMVVQAQGLTAGATDICPEVIGRYLAPGDFIAVLAGTAAAISIASSGRELT